MVMNIRKHMAITLCFPYDDNSRECLNLMKVEGKFFVSY